MWCDSIDYGSLTPLSTIFQVNWHLALFKHEI